MRLFLKIIKKFLLRYPNLFRFTKFFYNIYKYYSLKYFSNSNKSIFENIYKFNVWEGEESRSGSGSSLSQTETIIKDLPELFEKYKIYSILDIPCGDFYWMKEVDLSKKYYIGADIVDDLIKENRKKYSKLNLDFLIMDLIKDKLPKSDLIFTRDCLVHFSNEDIFLALKNIIRSESKYFLTTNFSSVFENINIATGQFRAINLLKEPFNLPKPIFQIVERCTEGEGKFKDKGLALWDLNQLKKIIS